MRSYDNANCIVRREQAAVDGSFLFFQKSKLKAVHVFQKSAPKKDATLQLKIGDEQIGEIVLSESFNGSVTSSALLDVVIPQGSVVDISGATGGYGVLAEYEVMPDADETTTNVDRR
jgi:hypothetical protein